MSNPESRAKVGLASKGNQFGKKNAGRKQTEEHKANRAASWKANDPISGDKNPMKRADVVARISLAVKNSPKIACPHCNVTGQHSVMHRWHFDNCKHREETHAAA